MARKATPKYTPPLVHHLPITKARINLGAVVKQVHLNKEYVILEKDGIPIAGLMDIDEFEDYLELQDPKVRAHIRVVSLDSVDEYEQALREDARCTLLMHDTRSTSGGSYGVHHMLLSTPAMHA